ncbi:hypothetical protein T12_15074 [Trichinella patagoniensis]|uniref:Uncharacterized protein n=1 Tax=Trichinella patagoniensis TaxID=990121 RepID=A0A0V0ZJL9_9BILA|nr:hypothetical protein T12_15074 [Trichinella patagoniensis]
MVSVHPLESRHRARNRPLTNVHNDWFDKTIFTKRQASHAKPIARMSRQSVSRYPSGSRHPPTSTHMLCQKSPTPVWSWSVSFGQIGHL